MTKPIPHALTKPAPGYENESTPLLPLPNSAPRRPQSTELAGYFLMVASCFGFSIQSFYVHIAEDRYKFPTSSAVFFRGVFHTLLSILYIACYLPFRQTFTNISARQWKFLAFRGISGALGIVSLFTALQKLPIGDAVTLFFCGPAMTMILSNIFLSEPITQTDCIAAVISFVGVVLTATPDFGVSSAVSPHDRIIGSVFALSGAFWVSVAYVTIRSLGTRVHFILSVFSYGASSMITSVFLGGALGPAGFMAQKEASLLVSISVICAFSAQCCLTRGLQLCRAGPGTLIRNHDVPIAYIMGIMFLAEVPTLLRLFGSTLVLVAACMIGARQILRA